VNSWLGRLGGRGRGSGAGALVQIAREVVSRRRSLQGALNEVRHPGVLDALSDDDFRYLDVTIAERVHSDREFALVLARLTHTAARAKGFERQTVDAALRLDSLLPTDDPSREREKLLRDAYAAAQRSGYLKGGRQTLARLGYRSLEAGDTERARALFQQQLDIAPDQNDSPAEVETALTMGDMLRKDGDLNGAQEHYRRAGRSAQRLDFHRGLAEALTRQIDLLAPKTPLETVAALQRQALDAADRTGDYVLRSRIVVSLAETLTRSGKAEEAAEQLEAGLEIAREIGDLSLESRCLDGLVSAQRRLGRLAPAALHERELFQLEERLGNRPAAAAAAVQLGTTLLALNRVDEALEIFERALRLAELVGDLTLEQRALGGLGIAQAEMGHPADALDNLMRALDFARRANDPDREAKWLGAVGQTLWRFGQYDDAVRTLGQALHIARRVDDQPLEAGLQSLLGRVHASAKQTTRARECFGRALDLYRRQGETGEVVAILSALGNLSVETGQPAQATVSYEEALELAAAHGEIAAAARLHGKLGRLAQKRHDAEAALDHFERAVELAERVDEPALLSKALQHFGAALHAAGDEAAVDVYRDALELTQDIGDERGEALVRLNLGTLLSANGSRPEGIQHLHHAAALAARFGDDGATLRRHVDAAIAAFETQSAPLEPSPRPTPRRIDPPRSRGDRSDVPVPRPTTNGRARPDGRPTAPPDGEDRLFREATLPPE
jgi:tetratricopeptide (TPR) repeat protein